MEQRESFIFYRSWHEAIKCMSEKVQVQIYSAICDYALDGKEPENLCKEAQGMFLLVQPIIAANKARRKNGKQGAEFGKLGGRPPKNKVSATPKAPATPLYTATFEEEAEQMKQNTIWNEAVCMQYSIDRSELCNRLDAFANHCKCECQDKPHTSASDAQRHFCAWMRKVYKIEPRANNNTETPDYQFSGGFGGQDV